MARLPKSIIKKYGITKKAWSVFRGRKSRSRKTSRRKKSNPKRGVIRRLPRRRYGRRRRSGKSMTRTAFKLIRIGALAAPALVRFTGSGSLQHKASMALMDYTGFGPDGSYRFERMARGWMPFLGACLATYGIPKITSIIRKL